MVIIVAHVFNFFKILFFFIFSNKWIFCCYFIIINIAKFLQQVYSRGLQRSLYIFLWEDWDGVGSLHCNGQSSFENWGSIPLQVPSSKFVQF